jgi:hypothetical protein
MDASSTWRVLFDAIGYSSEPRASSRSLDLAPCPISDIIYHLVAVFSFPVSLKNAHCLSVCQSFPFKDPYDPVTYNFFIIQ